MRPIFKVPLYKRILSYLYPVSVTKGLEEDGSPLQVILHNNTWQLASETALYSDGTRYRPFKLAFSKLHPSFFPGIRDCLILGTGLGSIVQILHKKYNASPDFYLVEKEEKIIYWAVELLQQQGISKLHPYCCDAITYLEKNKKKYDLICVDIFKDREVPASFTTRQFFDTCNRVLQPGGIWIMNYIINNHKEWKQLIEEVKNIFPGVIILENEQNRVLISGYVK